MADPTILAGRVDAVLIVVQAGVTPRDGLEQAVKRLEQVRVRILGTVLNQFDIDQEGYYGYRYKRYYGEDEPRSASGSSDTPEPARQPRRASRSATSV